MLNKQGAHSLEEEVRKQVESACYVREGGTACLRVMSPTLD